MIYKNKRKANFRISEARLSKRKAHTSSALLLSVLAISTWSMRSVASEISFSSEALKTIVSEHFEQEIARSARSNNWPDYQADYRVWVPGSANHLPVCKSPLTITARDNRSLPIGHLKRAVSCQDAQTPWRINVTIKSAITLPIVVANSTISRNEAIAPSQLRIEKQTITRQHDFYTQINQVTGLEATRRIRTGQIIDPATLTYSALIEKGNQVVVIAQKQGFSATIKGVALEQGRKGQQIEVKNISSGKVIKAIVTGLNQVHTQF